MFEPKATASHLDSTRYSHKSGRHRRANDADPVAEIPVVA